MHLRSARSVLWLLPDPISYSYIVITSYIFIVRYIAHTRSARSVCVLWRLDEPINSMITVIAYSYSQFYSSSQLCS